jgi:hypothetical protein
MCTLGEPTVDAPFTLFTVAMRSTEPAAQRKPSPSTDPAPAFTFVVPWK